MTNNTNNSKENSESNEIKKKSSSELKEEFLLGLKDDYKNKKTSEKTIFLNKILKSNSNNLDWLKDVLEKFKKQQFEISLVNENKLWEFDINQLNLNDLKNTFKEDLIKITIDRNLLKKQLLNDYELDEKTYNSNILIEVEKIEINGFTDLKKSKKSRKEFLINILWWIDNLPLEKNKINLFEHILNLKEEFNKIKDNKEKHKLLEILQVLENRDKSLWLTLGVRSSLVDLLELNLLSNDIKVSFLRDFIPILSYSEIKNIWVNFDDDLIKNQIINNIFSKEEINNFWLDLLKDNINLNELFFETKDLSDADILSIFNWWRDIKNSIIDNFSENFDLTLNKGKEEVKDKWPNTLSELSSVLKTDANDLIIEEWKILKIVEKDEKGKEKISYIRIIKWDDKKRELTILNIWSNEYEKEQINLKLPSSTSTEISYFEFNKKLNKDNIDLHSYSESEIKNKISDSNDTLDSSELLLYNKSDLKDDKNKQKLIWSYNDSIKDDILSLERELEEKWWENSFIKEQIKEKEDELLNLDNNKLLDFLNLRELLKRIDKIDPEWKELKLCKWLILETEKMTYEIDWVSENKVILKSRSWIETLSFEEFFQAFKGHNAKRIKKINDFWKLIDNFKGDNNKWNKYEFKDWNFIVNDIEKWNSKLEKENVEYFTSEKNDKIVKVNSIEWDKVVLQFWERKSTNTLEKKDKNYDEKGKWEILYISWADKITLTLNEFQKYIKENQLDPNWKTGKRIEEKKPDDLNKKFHGWFVDKVFKRFSVAELIAWWKIFIDNLAETMKKWNDVHAAHVALAMWQFLPEEVKADLKIKVEQAEAEEMEKAIKWLWDVDSSDAIKRIKWWILNKDTPEFKKEAGLMFVMKKYGTLTWKPWLYDFKWKFLWYEALWWRKNDELYLQIKEEYESWDPRQAFTEERLVYILLLKQSKWWHRRSRLYKEYENNWKSWMKEEAQKWYDDASNYRNAKDMIKWGNWELLNWNLPNAVGWYKKVIERWWSLEDMSEGFFLMLFSWALYTTHETIYTNHIKSLWDSSWMPMIFARMSSNVDDMKFLNEVIVSLSKDIEESNNWDPKYKWMHDTAQSIFNDAISWKWTEKSRVNRSLEFWKKYWKELSRALNMNHVWESSSSKTDKNIILKKDDNKLYGKYFDKVREFTPETFKEELMYDAMGGEWISWLNLNQVVKKYFKLDSTGAIFTKSLPVVEVVWWKMWKDINSVKDKDFTWWDNEKRKYLKFILSDLLSWFVVNHNPERWLLNYASASPFKDDMEKWWIDINFLKSIWKYSSDTILKWDNNECNALLNKVIDNILSWNTSSIIDDDTSYSSPLDLVEETQIATKNTLW